MGVITSPCKSIHSCSDLWLYCLAAVECEPLDAIANGIITYADDTTPNFDLGTTATYACNEGYFLDVSVGSEVRTCVDDTDGDALGVFDGQAPSCVRKC